MYIKCPWKIKFTSGQEMYYRMDVDCEMYMNVIIPSNYIINNLMEFEDQW